MVGNADLFISVVEYRPASFPTPSFRAPSRRSLLDADQRELLLQSWAKKNEKDDAIIQAMDSCIDLIEQSASESNFTVQRYPVP